MKIIIVASFLTISSLLSPAQDVYEKLAKETCDCITKKALSKSSKKEIEMQLGLCMIASADANSLSYEVTNKESMTELGKKVGIKMAGICPVVFTYLTEASEEKKHQVIDGKIKSVVEGEFNYLIVKDDSGREQTLLWLRYFKGSEELQENWDKVKGKKVKVSFENIECFSPKSKAYINQKEIVELVFEN